MILLIDNYDSFTFNLVQVMAGLGAEITVYRNDAITVEDAIALQPSGIVISPGPCTPREAGVSCDLIQATTGRLPLLGVCLGHQCIGASFGGTIVHAGSIMHGKVSQVSHTGTPLYRGLRSPFPAGRYHSLAVLRDTLPECLCVDAETEDGEIMGMHHVRHPTYGVQFHPESVLTPLGKRLLKNFLGLVESFSLGKGASE